LAGTVVVVLGPILLIHELGHFLSAKAAGVRVEEFGFGYPPRLLTLWRGRGHLVVGGIRISIPRRFRAPPRADVGSWVELSAEEREDGSRVLQELTLLAPTEEEPTATREQSGGQLRLRGEVSDYEPGTIYSLNLLPMGAFVRMLGEEDPSHPGSLAAQPKRWRLAVMGSGAALNVIFAFVLLISAYWLSGIPDRWLVEVDSVVAGTPAYEAGLSAGDIITAVDGVRLANGDQEFREIILESVDRELQLSILRDGEELALSATPQLAPEGGGYLGVYMARRPDPGSMRRFTLPEAVESSSADIVELLTFPLRVRRLLAEGEVTPEQVRPNSVVGIGGVLTLFLQQSLEWRWSFLILHTAGLVSLSLGIANLLPLPALDGGRMLFVLIEAVRGRRIAPEREAMVHVIGLLILVGLMALVMVQDVVNPVIPWDWLKP
jgi:regulator of sigma E protease